MSLQVAEAAPPGTTPQGLRPAIVRRRGLVRPPTSDETRYLNEAFGHRRVVIAAGTVFVIVMIGMVSAVAVACAYAAYGIEISAVARIGPSSPIPKITSASTA